MQKKIIEFRKTAVNDASGEFYAKESASNWQSMLDKGVKLIKFSPADGQAFVKLAYDSAWDYVIAKSPVVGPKLKEMLVK